MNFSQAHNEHLDPDLHEGAPGRCLSPATAKAVDMLTECAKALEADIETCTRRLCAPVLDVSPWIMTKPDSQNPGEMRVFGSWSFGAGRDVEGWAHESAVPASLCGVFMFETKRTNANATWVHARCFVTKRLAEFQARLADVRATIERLNEA